MVKYGSSTGLNPSTLSNTLSVVISRTYTQYIPLSIYELQTWMGSPSIYVWDCNNAGMIVENFKTFAEQHEQEFMERRNNPLMMENEKFTLQQSDGDKEMSAPPSLRNCIQLAACGKDQLLPMNPELAAADLFTACLTTPIKMALRWFVMRNDLGHLATQVKMDQLEKIPGQFGDRRTMLGELNWIFTAFDADGGGTIDPDEITEIVRWMFRFAGIEEDPDLLASCVIDVRATIDQDSDGDITKDEFIQNAMNSVFIAEVLKERKKRNA